VEHVGGVAAATDTDDAVVFLAAARVPDLVGDLGQYSLPFDARRVLPIHLIVNLAVVADALLVELNAWEGVVVDASATDTPT
jgi:hypothetical protein